MFGAFVVAAFALLSPDGEQVEAATDGAAMSLSIYGQTGVVKVANDGVFTVIVQADSIPLTKGYVGVQVWLDFGTTGLTNIGNPLSPWPDCHAMKWRQIATGEHITCFTSGNPLAGPPSYYKGSIFSLQATCESIPGSVHTIRLVSAGDPVATTSGTSYLDENATTIPAAHTGDFIADEIQVICDFVTPTPLPDTDGDGCLDQAEQQTAPGSETTGGLRNANHPWDFYDVAISGGVKGQDRQVDLFNDIVGVIDHYAPVGTEPEYDVWYDRGPSAGPNAWNMTAPDGKIDLFNDIVGVIAQFGHDCR